MAEHVPRVLEILWDSVLNPNWADLRESSELGSTSGSTLKPDNQRRRIRMLHDILTESPEKIVKHPSFALRVIPINLLIA